MTNLSEIDLVEELQLRRWARMNYVPPQKRDRLHPVTVTELETMDRESGCANLPVPSAQVENRPEDIPHTLISRFVPLADYSNWRWDPPEPELNGPKFTRFAGKRAAARFADAPPPEL